MSTPNNTGQFTMFIPLEAHRRAQQFRQHHADAAKGKQVYLNTLAVYAVHEYLRILGIDADLAASASWNPVTQALADTAALWIAPQGQLECRPVLPAAENCHIPPETWSDRLGYIAVQFDSQLETATLLGFIQTVQAEEVTLQQFEPLETCLDVLTPQKNAITHLSQWLQNVVETGWQTLDKLVQTPQPALNFRGRKSPIAKLIEQDDSIIRCHPLALGMSDRDDDFALVVSVKPYQKTELDIWVKIFPLGNQAHLPGDLELKLTDVDGEPVMQAQSRETEAIGLKFRGEWGDRFNIQIKTNETTVVEHFMI